MNSFRIAFLCNQNPKPVLSLTEGSKIKIYLMTLSARTSTFGGIVTPMCFAVFRLITNSNFMGASTKPESAESALNFVHKSGCAPILSVVIRPVAHMRAAVVDKFATRVHPRGGDSCFSAKIHQPVFEARKSETLRRTKERASIPSLACPRFQWLYQAHPAVSNLLAVRSWIPRAPRRRLRLLPLVATRKVVRPPHHGIAECSPGSVSFRSSSCFRIRARDRARRNPRGVSVLAWRQLAHGPSATRSRRRGLATTIGIVVVARLRAHTAAALAATIHIELRGGEPIRRQAPGNRSDFNHSGGVATR